MSRSFMLPIVVVTTVLSVGVIAYGYAVAVANEVERISVTFVHPDSEEPPACPPPITCPPPEVRCDTLHERAVKAVGEARVADAYVRGVTAASSATTVCAEALEEMWPPTEGNECSATASYWDMELDIMQVVLQADLLDLEVSRWFMACEELARVWPTPEGPHGEWPEDFPEFCR